MKPKSFAELYCMQQGIPATAFAQHLFRRALYPHARPLAWLVNLFSRTYFEPDRAFVEDVAKLTRYTDFFSVAMDYSQNSSNLLFLRRVLRLRVSTERMRQLVRPILKATGADETTGGTLAPFCRPDSPSSGMADQHERSSTTQ
jgi:hypothetical protein